MAEYDFWDDRTTEENDENYCPILNDHCYDMSKCDECADNIQFANHFQKCEMMSLRRMQEELNHGSVPEQG